MRWQGNRESDNVEDQRDGSEGAGEPEPGPGGYGGGGGGGGGGGMPPMMAVGGGVGTLILVVVVYLLGGDPRAFLQQQQGMPQQQRQPQPQVNAPAPPQPGEPRVIQPGEEDEMKKFVRTVLADTEDTWTDLFRRMNKTYRAPHLVLFSHQTRSACGRADAAVGPFYCPGDDKVYIDLAFYQELKNRFHAPGEFAEAYVLAHEVGHHVQNLLGITAKVDQMRGRISPSEMNKLSVKLELQADFFAGVWAHHAQKARNILESGDVESALTAASAIGDDRLQKQARGYVVPDSFTHGTSAQRMKWFSLGLKTGDINQGDTFSAPDL